MAVVQQSGKVNRASRAKHTIWRSRANCSRATGQFAPIWPIGPDRQSCKSGKSSSRAIGQIRQSGKANPITILIEMAARLLTLPDCSCCQTCQIAHFARLRRCKCARLPAARLGQIAICQSGQSGNRAHDPHDCL